MDTHDLSPLAQALGRVPTGLFIVTTRAENGPLGFVGSFLMQVGLDPPALMVAVGADREHLGAIRARGRFAVSVLDESGSKLMGPFFKKYPAGESAFDTLAHAETPGGLPYLSDALAWLDCRVTGEHASGDHVCVFGAIEHGALLRPGEPSIHLRQNGLSY